MTWKSDLSPPPHQLMHSPVWLCSTRRRRRACRIEVPSFPFFSLFFPLGSSWLRESSLPSPEASKCPTGPNKNAPALYWSLCHLGISSSLTLSVPLLFSLHLFSYPPSSLSLCPSLLLSHLLFLSPLDHLLSFLGPQHFCLSGSLPP